MTTRHLYRRFTWLSIVGLTATLALPPAQGQDVATDTTAHAGSDADAGAGVAHLEHLAETGRFEEVLARLQSDFKAVQTPAMTGLVADLQRFTSQREEQKRAREEAYAKALAEAGRHLEAGRLQDALVAAIDAQLLGETRTEALADPTVQAVVAEGGKQAKAAEEANEWIEALTLYRALDLLYDDYATFHADVKRVAKHVTVLQLYAPEKLQALYEAQAAKRAAQKAAADAEGEGEAGEAGGDAEAAQADAEPPTVLETDTWTTRLRGISPQMLDQIFAEAAEQHVEHGGYQPLLRGAIESLLIVLRTPDIVATFPTFADVDQRSRFEEALEGTLGIINDAQGPLGSLEARLIVQSVLKLNRETLKLPDEVITYELAEGAMGTLDDFSAVIWPDEVSQFTQSTEGRFTGVGIQISRRDGRLVVVTPLPDTPAQEAGIKAGDIIAEVNGKSTSAWSLDRAVREIKGPEGTAVTLGVERAGEVIPIDVKRAEIVVESIRGWEYSPDGGWEYWIDPADRIGYVRINSFVEDAADRLDSAVAQMQQDGPINGLILDLRYNPGGWLTAAIEIVDRFIDKGAILSLVDSSGRKKDQSPPAHAYQTYRDFPLVILINEGSASASEIVSGALQDHDRATIVGSRSFGKGSVQDVMWKPSRLDPRWGVKLTTQYYQLPMGRMIHRKPGADLWGVEPDLSIGMTRDQLEALLEYRQKVDVLRQPAEVADGEDAADADAIIEEGMDPQLSAAILIVKTQLLARDLAIAQAHAQAD